MKNKKYVWKDVVEINGKIYAEEFEISGMCDDYDCQIYQIDKFLESVAKKYKCEKDDIKTYMMDNIKFNANELKLPFSAEDCGLYINDIPEWIMGDE